MDFQLLLLHQKINTLKNFIKYARSNIKRRKSFIINKFKQKVISENIRFQIDLPFSDLTLTPFLFTIPLQLLSYHVALFKKCDIDKPRNLAKSVTVE